VGASLDPRSFDLTSEVLRTERLDLIPYSVEFCRALAAGDRVRAEQLLGYDMGDWPEGGELDSFARLLPAYERDPSEAGWHGRAIVVRGETRVAGSVNLKGRPVNGRVEVGYQLDEAHRGHGYAREAARAAVTRAFADPATTAVVAVIEPSNAASIAIAESLGMHRTDEASQEHPGSLTWVVGREAWERGASPERAQAR